MHTKPIHTQNRGTPLGKRGGYTVTECLIVLALLGVISLIILGLIRRGMRPASERDTSTALPAAAAPATAPSSPAPTPTTDADKKKAAGQ